MRWEESQLASSRPVLLCDHRFALNSWIISEGPIRVHCLCPSVSIKSPAHHSASYPTARAALKLSQIQSHIPSLSYSYLLTSFSQHIQIHPSIQPPPLLTEFSQYDNSFLSALLPAPSKQKCLMNGDVSLKSSQKQKCFFSSLFVPSTRQHGERFIASPVGWILQKKRIFAKTAVFRVPGTLSLSASGRSCVMN